MNSCEKKEDIVNLPKTELYYSEENSGPDNRLIENGVSIFKSSYIDQPYVVKYTESNWVCMYTKSDTNEGSLDSRLGLSISFDKGQTWNTRKDIDNAVTSYAVPYLTNQGRIYAFYTYNKDKVLKHEGGRYVAHLVGDMCYKYSDDGGENWSNRYTIKLPETQIDLTNEFKGKYQNWWTICKPITANGEMYFSFTKRSYDLGEGFILHCPNINNESNVNNLIWDFYPSGPTGIKSDKMGNLQEEHNIVQMNNGNFCCVFRTGKGYPGICYSYDNCKTWTNPQPMTYSNGDTIRNPIACPRIFKRSDGKYLFWFHNNSYYWEHRNPAWVSGGTERDGKIAWSQPEILFYSNGETNIISYPDLIEDSGNYYMTETQKRVARISKISNSLLGNMWGQESISKDITSNKVLEVNEDKLSSIASGNINVSDTVNWNGISIEIKLKNITNLSNAVLFSILSSNSKDTLIRIKSYSNNKYGIELFSNKTAFVKLITSDEKIPYAKSTVLSFNIDPNSQILTGMINGILFKGNSTTKQGWATILRANNFNYAFGKTMYLNNSSKSMQNVRIYNKYLTTSQQIFNYNNIIDN